MDNFNLPIEFDDPELVEIRYRLKRTDDPRTSFSSAMYGFQRLARTREFIADWKKGTERFWDDEVEIISIVNIEPEARSTRADRARRQWRPLEPGEELIFLGPPPDDYAEHLK
jgi:hypothetical protein